MDLSLGTSSNIPSVPLEASFGPVAHAASGPTTPRAMVLAQQLALTLLMPSSFNQIQATSRYVARSMVRPAPTTDTERDERKKGEMVRRLKILRSEASGQQSRGR